MRQRWLLSLYLLIPSYFRFRLKGGPAYRRFHRLPSVSSLPWRLGYPLPTPCNFPCTKSKASKSKRGGNWSAGCCRPTSSSEAKGDVGRALCVYQDGQPPILYSRRRPHTRVLKTIFGPVAITRIGYYRAGAESIHPLDESLQLPERSFSYEFQKRMVKAVVQGPFREAGERIAEITGAPIPVRSLEDLMQQAAQDLDAFYAERTPPASTDTGSILVAAVDGKGIPMIKPKGGRQAVRRTKGQKANRKKMATVATVFTRAAWIRTSQQVVESLFARDPSPSAGQNPPPPRPEHKRVWASLTKGKAAVIGEVAAEVSRRDPQGHKTHVALTDGERALPILVSQKLQVTLILDLLHVLEKLWKAAYVFHVEGSVEAEQWVRLRAQKILDGHVSQVVQGVRQTITKLALRGSKRKVLASVSNYLGGALSKGSHTQFIWDRGRDTSCPVPPAETRTSAR